MKRKITITATITAVLLLTMSLLSGCSAAKIIETDYYSVENISTVKVQYVNTYDVASRSGIEDRYGIGGVFDSQDRIYPIVTSSESGKWNGKLTDQLQDKGVQIEIEVSFRGNYNGCILRIWTMDQKTFHNFYAIVDVEYGQGEYDEYIAKCAEFIKKNADIVEWKL